MLGCSTQQKYANQNRNLIGSSRHHLSHMFETVLPARCNSQGAGPRRAAFTACDRRRGDRVASRIWRSARVHLWVLSDWAEQAAGPAMSATTPLATVGPKMAVCRDVPIGDITLCYSITSSATLRSLSGIVRPSALAVLRLITSSNVVGCSIGKSPGFAPLKILSTYKAACRASQWVLAP